MMRRLALFLAGLTARERRLLAALAFVIGPLGLVYGAVMPLVERRAAATDALAEAQAQLVWVGARQAELAALPEPAEETRAEGTTASSPIGISGIETSLVEAGLRGVVEQLASTGRDGVVLHFGAVAFTELMEWLETVEAQAGYAIGRLQLERAGSAGLVAAQVELEPRS